MIQGIDKKIIGILRETFLLKSPYVLLIVTMLIFQCDRGEQ